MAHEALQRLEALVRGKRYKDYAGTFLSQCRWLSDFLTANPDVLYGVTTGRQQRTPRSQPFCIYCVRPAQRRARRFPIVSVSGPSSYYQFELRQLSHGAVINSQHSPPIPHDLRRSDRLHTLRTVVLALTPTPTTIQLN